MAGVANAPHPRVMPAFAILIDENGMLSSAPSSQHADLDAAVRSTIQTAAMVATEGPSCGAETRSAHCEVHDPRTGETRLFTVTVTVSVDGGVALHPPVVSP